MHEPELLKRLARSFDDLAIPYMVCGSVASSVHGEPRFTNDIDVVVELSRPVLDRIRQAFPREAYYLDEEAAVSACVDGAAGRRQFNILDLATFDKLDVYRRPDTPYDRTAFERRRWTVLPGSGLRICVLSPEDTILSKLAWAKSAGLSEKQLIDAGTVFKVRKGVLDTNYLNRWAEILGVGDLLDRLRGESAAG